MALWGAKEFLLGNRPALGNSDGGVVGCQVTENVKNIFRIGLQLGDEIEVKFTGLGPRGPWISRIVALDRSSAGITFVDRSLVLPWPFASFEHHHGFEADRSPIFDDQAVSLAIRNDACVATLRLSVAEERYNRALFATVTAAQDAKTALSGIAVARVTLNRSESVAERRAAAGDDVVIRVHHAFVAGYIDA